MPIRPVGSWASNISPEIANQFAFRCDGAPDLTGCVRNLTPNNTLAP
jgi:hypothetical protein